MVECPNCKKNYDDDFDLCPYCGCMSPILKACPECLFETLEEAKEKLKELINEERVLVDFFAEWCGPCRMLSPIIDEVATEQNIKVIKVNVDNHEDIAKKYGIMSIPTIILFKNGEETNKNIGLLSKEDLLEFIK